MQRTALVTGASRGIGRACAIELARAGHRVILAARNRDLLGKVAEEIGGNAHVVEMDLANEASIRMAFAGLKDLGPVTILVNNAGITRDTLALRMSAADWDAVIDTNLKGAFLCMQQALPGMLKARWGRIVNIASVVGQTGNAGQANYSAAKAGLIGMTKAIAQEVASRNITANCVAPGFIETDMTAALAGDLREKLLQTIPMKRFGKPEDIAAAVRFLASEEAGYITGATLNVNGGMYM
jgi:3-oxoacyl-[acyl-carrier protein] reductase